MWCFRQFRVVSDIEDIVLRLIIIGVLLSFRALTQEALSEVSASRGKCVTSRTRVFTGRVSVCA